MANPIKNIINWYFSKKALPYWIVLCFDSFMVFISGFIAYWLFHRGYNTVQESYRLAHVMLLYVALSWIGMRMFHTFSGIIRYSSFVDLRRVANANIMSIIIVWLAHYAVYRLPSDYFAHLTSREIIMTFFIAAILMGGTRIVVKTLYESSIANSKAMRALVYGTMSGGVAIATSITAQEPKRFLLKGFITHEEHNKKDQLLGQKIYSPDESLPEVIQKEGIEAVLISPLRNEQFRSNQALQDMLINSGVKIFMATNAKEWDGNLEDYDKVNLQEVQVEDLLPRDEIEVDLVSVGNELRGKRILITGSAGSIGSEIVRQVASFEPAAMVLIDQAETPQHDIRLMMAKDFPNIKAETIVTSISRQSRMEKIFKEFRPQYVFHAAAYKHVPMMEDNPTEAVMNNIYGTKVIADFADLYGVEKFVMVSTDKAVNPTNVMGCSKRICEIYVQALGKRSKTQFVTTRFGNVLGSNGSVIQLFREQIKNGGPVTVTHPEIIRFFMLIPEACKLVLEAGTKGKGGEIFVFDMGKPVKIADLAKRMISLSGAKNVKIEFTGLRPGEKLYEEVLNELEGTKPSFHKKIRIASVREYDFDKVLEEINELVIIARGYDDMATVKKMKEIVPEYKSNNSVYEVLDKK
jgi:FlaA1/EpsC-like NDP-sugar epimerase